MLKRFIALYSFLLVGYFALSNPQHNAIERQPGPVLISNLHKTSFELSENWRYMLDDRKEYATKTFNDSKWNTVNPLLTESDIAKSHFRGFAWFRIHVVFDSSARLAPVVLMLKHIGASEVYLDGELIASFGKLGPLHEERFVSYRTPIYIVPPIGREVVIAVRYSNTQYNYTFHSDGDKHAGFSAEFLDAENYYYSSVDQILTMSIIGWGGFVFFLSFGLVHFLLFIFYKARRSNFYFFLLCCVLALVFLYPWLDTGLELTDPNWYAAVSLVFFLLVSMVTLSMVTVLYSFFYTKFPKIYWIFLVFSMLVFPGLLIERDIAIAVVIIQIFVISIEIIRVVIVALRKKKRGAKIVSYGFGIFGSFILTCFVAALLNGGSVVMDNSTVGEVITALFLLAILSIPLSMSIFLAWDFAQTNRTLSKKLIEVEELSVRTIEQEKEKQKILAEQNEVLEFQVQERTKEINEQKKVIEEKNKDITDSINYAQRIQRSILPTAEEIAGIFKENFVLFKPRDIVSGDFYQFKKKENLRYAILADCTGHGVPGALMSMIGSNLLHQIIMERGIKEPNDILSELHKEVRSTLRQTSGVQSHDGMDAAIVLKEGGKLFIASANRPVYIVKRGELTELRPDKRSIGGSSVGDDVTFSINEVEIESGMMIYLFSDGYADQFGGDKVKKFKVKNLSELLVSISEKPLDAQREILNDTFDNWKKQLEQVDDVSLIGLKF